MHANMMINMRDLLLEDNLSLREVAQPVELPLSEEDFNLLQNMAAFVMNSQIKAYDNNNELFHPSIGLAAPQIGISKRMFVIALPDDENELFVMAVVNPTIEKTSNDLICLTDGEGCLSVQSIETAKVIRYNWIRWSGKLVDLETGEIETKVQSKLEGLLGIVFQHEYDHLNGILFTDIAEEETPVGSNDE